MRVAKILFLLFLALAATLFYWRLTVFDAATSFILEKAGAQTPQIHTKKLGLRQTRIKTLKTSFSLSAEKKLNITLHGLVLDYEPGRLLSTRKVNTISIDSLELSRSAPKTEVKKPLSLPDKISLIKDELREKFPAKALHIKQLLLKGDWPRQLLKKEIRLDLYFTKKELSAALDLQMTDSAQIHVELQSADARHAQIDITGEQAQDVFLRDHFILTPAALSGRISMRLEPVRTLLLMKTELSTLSSLPQVHGRLSGDFSLPLPMMINSNIQAEFTLDDRNDHITFKGSGNPVTKNIQFQLNGNHNDHQFFQTNVKVNQGQMTGDFDFQAGQLRAFIRPYLPDPPLEITGKISGTFNVPLPGSTKNEYAIKTQATDLFLPGYKTASVNLRAAGKISDHGFTLEPDSLLQAAGLISDTLKAEKLSLGIAGHLRRQANMLMIHLNKNQPVQITKLSTGKIKIDEIKALFKKPVNLYINQATRKMAATSVSLAPMRISANKQIYKIGRLKVELSRILQSGKSVELAARISSPSFIYQGGRTVPLTNINGNIELDRNSLTTDLQFSPETIPGRITLKLKHDLSTGKGTLALRSVKRLNLEQEGTTLANLFTPWNFPFDLDRGKISFKATGSWAPRKKFRLAGFVSVTNGDGFYKQFLLKGLNIRQDLSLLPRLYSKSEGSFSLKQLIGGLDIFNIQAKLNFAKSDKGSKPLIKINNFKASLLNGTINTPGLLYDQNRPDSTFAVNIKALDLEKLISLIQMKNLQVSGKISGNIPVTLLGKDISVHDGQLYNEPPGGEIHYTPHGVSNGGVTGYALKAVENFHYDSLKATAQYAPSGQLDLVIGLQGVSPSLDTSRRVHLNIHAEQNLPALLQSLRFSKGLTEELDKRVKDHYK